MSLSCQVNTFVVLSLCFLLCPYVVYLSVFRPLVCLLSSSPVFILVSLCLYVSIPFLFWESHVLFVLCSVLLPLSCQSDSIQQGSQLCPLCLNALQCISVLCCSREFCVSLVIWKLPSFSRSFCIFKSKNKAVFFSSPFVSGFCLHCHTADRDKTFKV